jgi:hypothetical protein
LTVECLQLAFELQPLTVSDLLEKLNIRSACSSLIAP